MKKINFLTMIAISIISLMASVAEAGNGPTSLTVYPTPQTLKVGQTSFVYCKQVGAIGGTYFKSEDETIASVTWGDLTEPHSYITVAQITAKKAGKVNIYAKCVNGLIATCEVTVIDDTDYSVDLLSTLSLQVNQSYTLVPVVTPPTAQTSFTWSSNNTPVAEVSQSGVVRAKSAGIATITVRASNGKTASCLVRVTDPVVYPTSVSVSPASLYMEVSQTASLIATVYPSNTSTTLTWSSSNSNVARVSNGMVTAVGSGTCSITVKTSNGKTASCYVTVYEPVVYPTWVSISPASLSLEVNQTATLTTTVYPSNATTSLIWSSSNNSVAKVSNGMVTAVGAGTCAITVRTSNGKAATCFVTVNEPVVYPTSVSITPSTLSLEVNQTANLTATVYPSNATTSLTWKSSNTGVATVSNGKVTAKGAGSCNITVTTSNGKTAACKVTVTQPEVQPTSVSVYPSSLSLEVNETANLTATVYPSNATTSLTWSTSNSSVAKVSNGKVTAVGVGSCKITVKTSNGESASCNVTVKSSNPGTSTGWSGSYSVTSSVDKKHVSDYNFPSSFTLKIKQVDGTYYVTEMLGLDLTHSIYEGIKLNMIDNQHAQLDLDDNDNLGGYTTTGNYLDGLYMISPQATYQWGYHGRLNLTRNSNGSLIVDDFYVFAFGGFTGYEAALDAVYHNVKGSNTSSSVPSIIADEAMPSILEIYNLNGVLVYSGEECGKPELAPGIYVFRRGGNVQKVMVR